MPRRRSERAFFVYRCQFQEDMFASTTHEPPSLVNYLESVLRAQSPPEHRKKYKNWRVANFLTDPQYPTLLYFRVGRIAAARGEHFSSDDWRFEEASQEESESSAIVFDSTTEYLLVEKNSQLDSGLVIRRLEYIFNSAAAAKRYHRILNLYEVTSADDAIVQLSRLSKIYTFRAWLRRPNPAVSRAYRRLYEGVVENSGSTEQTVTWKSPSGDLSVNAGSPVRGAVDMSADAYGDWKAIGRTRSGARKELQSDQAIETLRLSIEVPKSTLRSAFDAIQRFVKGRDGDER